jgi:hypothetical protein
LPPAECPAMTNGVGNVTVSPAAALALAASAARSPVNSEAIACCMGSPLIQYPPAANEFEVTVGATTTLLVRSASATARAETLVLDRRKPCCR